MDSSRCFAHRTCTVCADPRLVQLLLARFEAWRAPLATSPIPPRPSSCSTPLDTSCSSLWAGQFLLPDANVSSTCSFLSPLGRSGSRGMTTSSTDSLRLSRALPSEFSQLLRSERLCTSSNALCSVLGLRSILFALRCFRRADKIVGKITSKRVSPLLSLSNSKLGGSLGSSGGSIEWLGYVVRWVPGSPPHSLRRHGLPYTSRSPDATARVRGLLTVSTRLHYP